MTAVHIGAGNIGRGFIGQLLHDTGYEVVFLDRDPVIVAQLQQDGGYDLYNIEDDLSRTRIDNVRAIRTDEDEAGAVREIAEASLVTTSVWGDNLHRIAPIVAAGLAERIRRGAPRINVIACENATSGSELLRGEILKLGGLSAESLDAAVAFPNTAVDRLVLDSRRNGRRSVDVGKDYELVIERGRLVDPDAPPIEGAIYADDITSFIERKLWVINGGHVWAGLIGALGGFGVMQEIFAVPELQARTKATMREAAAAIADKYDDDLETLHRYIDFAIDRFMLPGTTDSVTRVCRSPIRKLQQGERLLGPALYCEENGLPNDGLVEGIAAAFHYDDPNDEQSVLLLAHVAENGIAASISDYCGIEAGTPLHERIVENYHRQTGPAPERPSASESPSEPEIPSEPEESVNA